MYSILHISDLHRSNEDPADNSSLLAALLADRDRYKNGVAGEMPIPNAIVISGDIIRGARLGSPNWEQSIRDQYAIAANFLSELCERFLDGNKRHIIMVPGNHDVCWNTSNKAMEKVPSEEYPNNLYNELVKPDSLYRWSWTERALFRIRDMELYEQRTGSYWDFIEAFYSDVKLPIPIKRGSSFQLFELFDRRIIVSAFDSTYRNDCLNFSGEFPRDAIGKCALALRDLNQSYDLKIAVWHHGIQGPPNHSDYLDVSQVQEMIGHDFKLGLHGHQHKARTQTQTIYLDQRHSMAIVSAGSLCAGAKELPRGINRQYNIIVINENFMSARIYVREMTEGGQFTRKQNSEFPEGFIDLSWHPPTNVMGEKIDTRANNVRRHVLGAESALRQNRPQEAVKMLDKVDTSSEPYAKKLLIEALQILKAWPRLSKVLQNPTNVEETVTLIIALIESDQFDDAKARLEATTEVDAATLVDLQNKLDIKTMMRKL